MIGDGLVSCQVFAHLLPRILSPGLAILAGAEVGDALHDPVKRPRQKNLVFLMTRAQPKASDNTMVLTLYIVIATLSPIRGSAAQINSWTRKRTSSSVSRPDQFCRRLYLSASKSSGSHVTAEYLYAQSQCSFG